jgi:hypothetical protein
MKRVKCFKYLDKNLTNQNVIYEGIKSRLKSGNACCHSVQNFLSSSLLSKNIKIKIYRIIIFLLFLSVRNLIAHIKGGTYADSVLE